MHEGHVGNLKSLFKSIHNYANMVFLHQQMKEELKVQAVLQILSKFDLDLWLQDHIGELKYLLLSTQVKQSFC